MAKKITKPESKTSNEWFETQDSDQLLGGFF